MRLYDLLQNLSGYTFFSGRREADIRGITCNSKDVRGNFMFVAVKGAREDGHVFIREALERGASAVVVEEGFKDASAFPRTVFVKVKDSRHALAGLAAGYFRHPARQMKVIAVTGTNGKTTISYLIEALLKKRGDSCAVIGTINYRFKDTVVSSKNTTPGPVELQSLMRKFADEGIRFVCMEVSSHALNQKRADGIDFSAALFTNLTQDHLDYHKTMENYFSAKARLFEGLPPQSLAVINSDDHFSKRLMKLTRARIIPYGIDRVSGAGVSARDIKMSLEGTSFTLCFPDGTACALRTTLIGRHNVYNILSAAAWARDAGFKFEEIRSAIGKFSCVPGRLEKINSRRGFGVYVDYAHTEDAIKNVITSLRQVSGKRIIVVFGCGGDRDRSKRPMMGRTVTKLADYAIITSDNPRSEDPLAIIKEIRKGISGVNYQVIPDRAEAIGESLSLARKGDVVLIAGKGHETYQVVQDKILHFDDREVVKKCLFR
ncbi:MAG: UDP-N-acetylmuramoyl-L-alanyl-D-glutamate--2,6-diaminopimelate ligase [Candidatus Omnitrophica bacterium]|nr:UDP-N-acetylmuramoyl-L-alanyl-D-glutamate--2,6-diaminopimelate ligase [Candidatus Omnitrophota bacterium]